MRVGYAPYDASLSGPADRRRFPFYAERRGIQFELADPSREYDLVEGFRDLGGNLAFLSANNYFWEVVRRRGSITKTRLWRDAGRPEASLIGTQYLANGKAQRQPLIIRRSRAGRWIFAGTGLAEQSRFGRS